MRWFNYLLSMSLLVIVSNLAHALESDWKGSVGPITKHVGDWHGSIGLGAVISPEYMGSSTYEIWPMPTIDAIYKKFLFISGTRGIGLQYKTPDNIIVGARLLYSWGRNNSGYLQGMHNLAGSYDGGLFMNYLYGPLFITSDFVTAISQQGHSGAYGALGVAYKFDPVPGWEIIPRAGITYASQQYMNAYFGVTPSESVTTGFPVYYPNAGLRDFSVGLIGNYLGFRNWRLYVSGGMNKLEHNANASPVVQTSAQFRLMSGFAYLF